MQGTDLLHFATSEQSKAQLDSWLCVQNQLLHFDNLLQTESKLVFPLRILIYKIHLKVSKPQEGICLTYKHFDIYRQPSMP